MQWVKLEPTVERVDTESTMAQGSIILMCLTCVSDFSWDVDSSEL